MLTDREKTSIVNSWRLVVPIKETAAELFYRRLFELRPDYRALFSQDMAAQHRKFIAMLSFIVQAINWRAADWQDDIPPEEDLFLVVLALGRRHTNLYRIPADSYAPVEEALMWTLDQGLGPAFDDDLRSAWLKLYRHLAQIMLLGGSAGRIEEQFGRR